MKFEIIVSQTISGIYSKAFRVIHKHLQRLSIMVISLYIGLNWNKFHVWDSTKYRQQYSTTMNLLSYFESLLTDGVVNIPRSWYIHEMSFITYIEILYAIWQSVQDIKIILIKMNEKGKIATGLLQGKNNCPSKSTTKQITENV